MNPERWERLQELFLAALDLPAADREGYVDRLDPEDADLADELRRMLDAHDPNSTWPLVHASANEHDPLLGETLGDYRLDTALGRGGTGVVYRATQLSKDRQVAVKVLRSGIAPTEAAYERFKREALAAARLHHPNLVRVLYLGRDEGLDYLVMELVEGPSLRDQMLHCQALAAGEAPKRAPDLRDPIVCAELVRDLARALQHAHDQRVLHRDVKPQNVLLDAEGKAHLSDFGLAKDLDLADLTKSGEVAGTPHYMSPEQARAVRDRIDHRTDVYSLGAVLYELLSGRTPAAGATTAEVIHNILHRPVVPLRRRNHEVPHTLALVCMQALRRRPDRRYRSAGEFADDLDRFLAGESVGAKAQGLAERAAERLVDRRVLVRLLPAAAVLGLLLGWGLYAGADVVEAYGRQPRVSVVVADGREAWIGYQALDARHLPVGAPRELGTTSDGRLGPQVVPAGDARIVVRTEDGASAELYRAFAEGDDRKLVAHPRDPRDDIDGMLVVRDRTVRPGAQKGTFVDNRAPGPDDVRVPAFAIDRACVTNGEYRDYLDATGRELPQAWTGVWRAFWEDPPREDWDLLPVVHLTFEEARAYAEWAGKRLVTALELEIAIGAYEEELWIERPGALEACNLGRPPYASVPEHPPPTTGGAYVHYVRPAVQDPLPPGAPVHHAVGNVAEWTETRASGLPGSGDSSGRRIRFEHWGEGVPSQGLRSLLLCEGLTHDTTRLQNQGFRCARTLGQ